jgi:hypothetical protein
MTPGWDVLAQIHEAQKELKALVPKLWDSKHVKGHQDTKKTTETEGPLTWPAKLDIYTS